MSGFEPLSCLFQNCVSKACLDVQFALRCVPARKLLLIPVRSVNNPWSNYKGLVDMMPALSLSVRSLEIFFVVNLPEGCREGGKPIFAKLWNVLYIYDFSRIILQCVRVWSWGLTTVGSSPAPLSFCAQINRTIRVSSDDSPRFLAGIEGSHSVHRQTLRECT